MSVRAARAAQRLRVTHLRSLSTSSETASGSQPARVERQRSKRWQPQENLRSIHPRMIFVRPWDGVQSIAHAFAIIREIERRFGKIQEFVVLRDSDVWTNNLPYMHATFARAEYTDAIPLEGRVIQVTMPDVDPERPGGVGLDDLEVYLDPIARAPEVTESETGAREAGPQAGKVMDVKLERSGMRDSPPPLDITVGGRGRPQGTLLLRNPARARELADALHSFGGFAMTSRHPVDLAKPKTRMQMLLQRWSPGRENTPKTVAQQPARSEEPSADPEPVPWTPFARKDEPLLSDSPLPSPASMPSGSVPPESVSPSPSPRPTANPPPPSAPQPPPPAPQPHPSATPPSPTATSSSTTMDTPSEPESASQPESTASKISKRQRMLLAARKAGANSVLQPVENDHGRLKEPTFVSDVRASVTDESPRAPAVKSDAEVATTRDEDNKRNANRWWGFLTGGR